MSELTEAAERYRDSVYEESEEGIDQCFSDRYKLANFAVNCLDPTPLADVTDEQWREMGFCEHDKISDTFRHCWSSGLYDYYPSDDLLFYDWVQYPTVKTLGQLRTLMHAIGGEA